MRTKHYEHPIAHHDPKEGFDRSEPNTPADLAVHDREHLAVLVLVIVAVQGYFEQIYQGSGV